MKNHRRVRTWAALAAADPALAASVLAKSLSQTSIDFRKDIKDRARRELVWTLERLAWKSTCFNDAIRSLALLAEAENETWANNATGEFVGKFQIYLGGTAVPFGKRLDFLDEIINVQNAVLLSLAIKALVGAVDRNAHRTVTPPISDEVPEKEWRPASEDEYLECVKECISRLAAISDMHVPETHSALVQAVVNTSMLLRSAELFPVEAQFIDSLRSNFPEARESLRRIVADLLHSEKKYWKELPPENVARIESLRSSLEEESLHARLLQYVGERLWDQEDLPELRPLAEELVADQDALSVEWAWLTSGEAGDAFRLGESLADVDADGTLAEKLPRCPNGGHDVRLICGYVAAKQRQLSNEWFDAWFESQYADTPKPVPLLFEVAWRCTATPNTVRRIVELLRQGSVSPDIVGRLVYGRWHQSLALESIKSVVSALVAAGYHSTAVIILGHRLKDKPEESSAWDELSLNLATCSELIRSSGMAGHSWKDVAETVTQSHASEVAAAILNEQARKGATRSWFLEHERYALEVIDACLKVDSDALWTAIRTQLESPSAYRFTIGFPKHLIAHVPAQDVMKWIEEDAVERASRVARIVPLDFSNDLSLAAQILGMYGDDEDVKSVFFGECISGSWQGSIASHWAELAQKLENNASETRLPKLRAWATSAAHSLRQMEERDRREEEEEELRDS